MEWHPLVIFIGGLIIILLGAEFVLRSSSRIAAMMGIRPIIIGLTVVSIGTSMPELAVGITAVSEGYGSLAVGNIAGTNMLNILFILGLSAALKPLPLHQLSIRLDVPVMIGAAVILFLMALDGMISRIEGIFLFLAAIVYVVVLIRMSKKESVSLKKEYEEEYSTKALLKKPGTLAITGNSVLLIVGIGLSVFGANLLVDGSVDIALSLGVSEALIGLTIVAIGTSAPELATTIMATIKNDRDVAIGNLIGSSISNILVILGLTTIASPHGVDVSKDILWLDLPLAAAVAIACYPVFRSNKMVSRTEGIVFVSLYLVYLSSLILLRT
ncbi:MAG TPA: calcium/sodium antiporter [Ferruginibacter sp.]|nr:sodium:calcium antiporter [Chitinophagaceae bacterium]HML57627.1 calcium/sodium antiporter [Ferruginibacter sp.]HRN92259.1 calcium/sodium antiporter [Ferruginibacter sp.]HRO06007.1 calcium/sodium antiporter [Ferruginibacter sp.]HRO97027.1 calcium/sodium antiporter [Ferruginibacter sp.]